VERYDLNHLNTLEYVAEDALAVWERLKAVTNFDETRSQLLVADRVPKGPLPVSPDQLRERLDYFTLRKALEEFLRKAQPDDLVVIYLGGHGAIKSDTPSAGVFFLPSDFGEENGSFRNALRMGELLNLLHVEFGGHKQSVQTVV